ncbi:MAG: methyl-accepting chemotaxis protein [Tindallia sp. MSAO_Bac2]|nr:MAG: methyl-accepting chemotaxis protein [Tindallia sp. MSAO_Bac2]
MGATITVGELLVALLALLGVGALLYLLMALVKINDALKNIQAVVYKNEKHIDESLERIPRVLENVEGITSHVNQSMEHVQTTVENVTEMTDYVTDVVHGINEEVVEPVKDLFKILLMLQSLFPGNKKKKKWF